MLPAIIGLTDVTENERIVRHVTRGSYLTNARARAQIRGFRGFV